jgi:2-keto-4-pentenoate hydratase
MYPDLDVAQAYSVQRLNLARRIGQGSALLGHKIGLTSAPMQKLLGVNEPDFGAARRCGGAGHRVLALPVSNPRRRF